jgi:CRISPR/Cas system endoribonuclease Cas6 (RAMP superfamily)
MPSLLMLYAALLTVTELTQAALTSERRWLAGIDLQVTNASTQAFPLQHKGTTRAVIPLPAS